MSIFFNNSSINDWNFGDDNIIKVYKHGAVCYYKVTNGDTPTPVQEPCFAVVDDITQYSDTEFEDVYDKATEKWYKLNNLNQYEEYGVYGSGRTSCEGSTSRLPQGYTEVEYIENTSTAYINLGVNPYSANGNSFMVESTFSSFAQSSLAYLISSECTTSPYYGFILRWSNNNLLLDGGSIGIDTTATNIPRVDGTSAITFYSDSTTTSNCNTPITLFCGMNGSSPWRNGKGKCYSFKLTINNNIVRDLVPAKRDSDDKYGMYDIVNDVFYVSPNNVNFSGGEPITPTDCVTTYEGKLTVDDEASSRLPQGYTEVEYVQNTGSSTINTNFYPNTNTRVLCEMEMIATQSYPKLFGAGTWNANNSLYIEFATSLSVHWIGSTSTYSDYPKSFAFAKHKYDLDKGNLYINDTLVGTKTYSSVVSVSSPLGIFSYINGSTAGNADEHFLGKLYTFKIYDDGALIRDFVPAKRDSDNVAGLYDIVNNVFYTPMETNIPLVAGEPITPTKTYEYMYSGNSWVNVGEVSGSTQIIKSPEYIEKDSSHNGKINLDYVWKTNSKMQFKFYSTNNGGGIMIGEDGMPDNNDCRMFFASTTAYFDWGSSRISWSSNGRKNTLYEYEYGNYYIKNMVTSASKTGSTISTSRTNPLYLGSGGSDRFRTYYLKFYDGDTLVKDFIPWTDMNGNYGLFDKVSLSVYNVASGSLTGSSNVTDVEVGGGYEYPLEYPVIQDPPDNLVFSSMTEAESYECPYVGMNATIDGDRYVFSGDSQSGYEWVYNPSRLPIGYTEVEYVQNTGTSYFDTNFKPNTNTRIVADMQQVTANDFPRLFGCNNFNATAGMNVVYEGGNLRISWFGLTSWTNINSVPTNYDRHVYDLNKNNFYVDKTLVASTTYSSSYQSSDNLGIFFEITGGRPGQAAYFTQETFKGKMYSFQIYDNGTLVRDLVPCIRDNDDTVGAFDIVNDVFYTVPTGYTTDKLIAGNPV